jgi:hypothetical protein
MILIYEWKHIKLFTSYFHTQHNFGRLWDSPMDLQWKPFSLKVSTNEAKSFSVTSKVPDS